jgi:hypothetical protein
MKNYNNVIHGTIRGLAAAGICFAATVSAHEVSNNAPVNTLLNVSQWSDKVTQHFDPTTQYSGRDTQYLALRIPAPPAIPVPPAPPHPRVLRPRGFRQGYYRQGVSLYAGYSQGSDTLREYNGDNLRAGDGFSYHMGWNADFKTGFARTALQWAIGYRSEDIDFKDDLGRSGSGSMTVFPVDMLGYFQLGLFRIGGGLTYHLFPSYTEEVHTSFGNSKTTIDYDNQLGMVFGMEFVGIRAPFFMGIRYTYIEYSPKDGPYVSSQTGETVAKVDGSTVGFYLGLHIR